jgi:hypothetical protein
LMPTIHWTPYAARKLLIYQSGTDLSVPYSVL